MEIKIAYEWHNKKTGHCYVDYVERKGMGELDGYIKTPLFKTNIQDRTETICIKFGRWILKNVGEDHSNGSCWLYEGKQYNTDELYKIFLETL
jgi:hypothetical protein